MITYHQLIKLTSTISKGETIGTPVYTKGAAIRFITASSKTANTSLSLQASIAPDGYGHGWFKVPGPDLSIKPDLVNPPPGSMPPAANVLVIEPADRLVGYQMLQPVISRSLSEDLTVEFWAMEG
jgi:hypothetical protein